MILNIRGTSGSGKTWLVRQIMEALDAQPILNEDGKIEGYLLKGNIRLVGSYQGQCGGCDTLGITRAHTAALREIGEGKRESLEASTQDSLSEHIGEEDTAKLVEKAKRGKKVSSSWASVARSEVLVREYARLGHVIFEGLLISGTFGRWAGVAEDCSDFVWAFMDTPLQGCYNMVMCRNGGRPVKMSNLKSKYDAARSDAKKAEEAGQEIVWVNHQRSFEQIMGMLHVMIPELWPTPHHPWNFSQLSPV